MDPLQSRLDALEQQMEHLQQQSQALQAHAHTVARQLRWWRGLAGGLLVLAGLTWALPFGRAQEDARPGGDRGLTPRLAALEHTLRHVTSATDAEGRPELVIRRANLRIVNGLGSTDCTDESSEPIPDCPNGLGNLIVGYNERRTFPQFQGPNIRTGSHNVVVGRKHNFSRFGGLVVGSLNEIHGDFAVVSGGALSAARGDFAVVNGGRENDAGGALSVVSGGFNNVAGGTYAAGSGGRSNDANGEFSVVSGGSGNTASGNLASVSGGRNSTQETEFGWAAGSEGEEVFVGNFRSP